MAKVIKGYSTFPNLQGAVANEKEDSGSPNLLYKCVSVCFLLTSLPGAGCDTRLNFKRSVTSLNSDFSFS